MKSPKNKLFSTLSDASLSEKSMESIQGGIRSHGNTLDHVHTGYWNRSDMTDAHTSAFADHVITDGGADAPPSAD